MPSILAASAFLPAASAFLFVIPEGNLLLSLLFLLPLFLLVLTTSLFVLTTRHIRLVRSTIRQPWSRLRARLQPCHTAIQSPAASAAEVSSSPPRRRFPALLKSRYAALATVFLTIALLGAADPAARTNKLGHEMICTCSCNQILMECNHVGCPVSPVMINELQSQVGGGGPDNLILNWFAAKYGATVLAAPMRGGFDNVAWITPLAVFFFATVGVAFLVTVWKKRKPIPVTTTSTMDATLRGRIRQETEY